MCACVMISRLSLHVRWRPSSEQVSVTCPIFSLIVRAWVCAPAHPRAPGRDVYYLDPALFRSQAASDAWLYKLCSVLGRFSRRALGVVSAARGLVSGPLGIVIRDPAAARPAAIPAHADPLRMPRLSAAWDPECLPPLRPLRGLEQHQQQQRLPQLACSLPSDAQRSASTPAIPPLLHQSQLHLQFPLPGPPPVAAFFSTSVFRPALAGASAATNSAALVHVAAPLSVALETSQQPRRLNGPPSAPAPAPPPSTLGVHTNADASTGRLAMGPTSSHAYGSGVERLMLARVAHLRGARARAERQLRTQLRLERAAAEESGDPDARQPQPASRSLQQLLALLRECEAAEARAEAELRAAVRAGEAGICFLDAPRPVPAVFSARALAAMFAFAPLPARPHAPARAPAAAPAPMRAERRLSFVLVVEKETVFQHLCRGGSGAGPPVDAACAGAGEEEQEEEEQDSDDEEPPQLSSFSSSSSKAAAIPAGTSNAAVAAPSFVRPKRPRSREPRATARMQGSDAEEGCATHTKRARARRQAAPDRESSSSSAREHARAPAANACAARPSSEFFSVRMNALVVTSKGYPTVQARQFLRALCRAHAPGDGDPQPPGAEERAREETANARAAGTGAGAGADVAPLSAVVGDRDALRGVPLLCLVDADPHGIDIYCRYLGPGPEARCRVGLALKLVSARL